MKDYLQRMGRSLMLPVSVLPAAALLVGIGNWILRLPGGVAQSIGNFWPLPVMACWASWPCCLQSGWPWVWYRRRKLAQLP